MKKLFLLPILILLLSACTSNSIDSNLYKDGKEIIQMTNDNIKAGINQYSQNQFMKVDNFRAKYLGNKMNTTDGRFLGDVEMTVDEYLAYGSNHKENNLAIYHKYLDELNSKYNINVN